MASLKEIKYKISLYQNDWLLLILENQRISE